MVYKWNFSCTSCIFEDAKNFICIDGWQYIQSVTYHLKIKLVLPLVMICIGLFYQRHHVMHNGALLKQTYTILYCHSAT